MLEDDRNCTLNAIMAQIQNWPDEVTAQVFRYNIIVFACDPNIARLVWVINL